MTESPRLWFNYKIEKTTFGEVDYEVTKIDGPLSETQKYGSLVTETIGTMFWNHMVVHAPMTCPSLLNILNWSIRNKI